MSTVKILGKDKLLRHLEEIAKMDLEDSVNKATVFIHAQAKNYATFSRGYSHGTLKGSIHMDVKPKKNEWIGKVFTNLYYAPYVEFGTGQRGNGSYPYASELDFSLAYKGDWAGMKAQPYMYPAAKRGREYVKKVLKADIKSKIR